jgi:hypothetical protein
LIRKFFPALILMLAATLPATLAAQDPTPTPEPTPLPNPNQVANWEFYATFDEAVDTTSSQRLYNVWVRGHEAEFNARARALVIGDASGLTKAQLQARLDALLEFERLTGLYGVKAYVRLYDYVTTIRAVMRAVRDQFIDERIAQKQSEITTLTAEKGTQ